MTDPYPAASSVQMTGAPRTTSGPDASVGEIVSKLTTDLTTLVRQELALAKAEISVEVGKAAKGGGLLGGAGFAGYMLALFASVAVMAALDLVMPLWAAAAIVAAVYGVVAAVLFSKGRAELKTVDPTPHQTIETLKEGIPR